jgi:cytolysin-activating lysine-acyltransferase
VTGIQATESNRQKPSARGGESLERVSDESSSQAAALRIMSGVQYLAGYSRLHASYPPEMLNRRILPSLPLGQFHYYTDALGIPQAFCNWAWLSPQVLSEMLTTGRDLEADEFNCGDLPFFYELLAPFGHCRRIVRELRSLPFFIGRRIPAIRGEIRSGGPFTPRVQYFQF